MVLYKQLVFIKIILFPLRGNKNYETMNAKVKVLRNVLQSVIDDIDNGKYDRTDAEIDAAIEVISLLNLGIKRYSKRYLCDNVLHCSESCFNNYLALGIIPAGEKIGIGFTEKWWSILDMREALEYRQRKKP